MGKLLFSGKTKACLWLQENLPRLSCTAASVFPFRCGHEVMRSSPSVPFRGSPLPGAHGRGPLLGVRPALVLPPSLRGMQAVCVRRLWRQREPVLLEGRVPELVRRAKVKPVRPQLELGGAPRPLQLYHLYPQRAASGGETSAFVHKCVKCWIYLYVSKLFCCKCQCECSKPFFFK